MFAGETAAACTSTPTSFNLFVFSKVCPHFVSYWVAVHFSQSRS